MAERVQAKLQWQVACERVAFALTPPEGLASSDGHVDLQEAIRVAQAALERLHTAFADDPGGA